MSTLSQFYSSGGPSSIIRGSTSYASLFSGGDAGAVTVNTGVTVNGEKTYLNQAQVSNMARPYSAFSYDIGNLIEGEASARISNNQIFVTTGGISPLGGASDTWLGNCSGVLYWEAITYG